MGDIRASDYPHLLSCILALSLCLLWDRRLGLTWRYLSLHGMPQCLCLFCCASTLTILP